MTQYENYKFITSSKDLKSPFRVLAQEKNKIKRKIPIKILFSKCQIAILLALQKRESGKIIKQSVYLSGNHMSTYWCTNLGFDRDSALHE